MVEQTLVEKGVAAENVGDYAKAVEWYTKAAEQGDANAQRALETFSFA